MHGPRHAVIVPRILGWFNPPARTTLCVMTSPREIHTLLEHAFNRGDLDAFVAAFEEDAAMVDPPTGELVSGRAAIRAALEPTFAMRPIASIVVTGELQADGLALTHANWTLAGIRDGEPVQLAGRGAIVSRRRPDGSWGIVLDNPLTPG
jgi:ketosteroid isomerase-like protein